ncbi:unnamed protein product [Gadus morhua 'NCC']
MSRSSSCSSSSCSCSWSAEPQQERRPPGVGASSALETLARELSECLPKARATPLPGALQDAGRQRITRCENVHPAGSPGTPGAREGFARRTLGAGQSPSRGPPVETGRTTAELGHHEAQTAGHSHEPMEEFFI